MPEDSVDSGLISEVLSGRLDAYETLIHRHVGPLRAFIAMRLPVPHLVDEIAHEVFVFAYRHLDDFKVGTDFPKWLRAIANNLVRKEVLRYSRSLKNQEKYLEHCLVEKGATAGLGPESPVAIYLEECVNRLPDKQRELIGLRYRLSSSTREMAERLNQSEAWVRTTLCRVRQALRDCIERKVGGESGSQAMGASGTAS